MNSKNLLFILGLAQLLFLVHFPLFAQKSTVGREFYVGYMDNNRRTTQPDKTIIIITANEKAAGIISTPKQSFPFSLEPGQQLVREFDGNDEGLIHRESGLVSFKSLRITSSGDLVVHAVNGREYSSDGTVVLPVTALGKEYLVTAHFDVFAPGQSPGSNQNFESTLLVIAIENNTEIEIIPSANTVNTVPAGSTINVLLNAGESYQVKASGDLTGSRVRVINGEADDCKLIAVFGGNKTTSAGTCGTSGDHMFQQAYPLESWGKSFIHIPLEGRTSGEIVKVLASQNGTVVRSNGAVVGTLNAGKFLKLDFGKNEIAVIETSKPSTVAVIAKSAGCNEFGVAPLGDPSLFTLSPNNQLIKSLTFSAGKLIGAFNQDIIHYLGILVPKGTASNTRLNGQNVGSQFAPVPGADFEYARIRINKGVNSVSNPDGFIGYAYGSGSIESYGFSIGTSLESIQYETETTYDFQVEGEKVACLDQEGAWEILPDDPKFTKFTWDFGDQSPQVLGKEVVHKFVKEGKFEVTVIASTGEDRCDSEEKFTFEVEVEKVAAKLQGPTSVCPGMDQFTYSLTDQINFKTALWEVDGGQILSQTDSTITVKWDGINPAATIKATPVAQNGCQGEVQELQVEITDSILPAKPKGQEGICGVQTAPVTYEIPFPLLGKNYNWTVEGGQLISGQNTTIVSVLWDNLASKRSIYYEESSAANPLCFGVSEILEIGDFPVLVLDIGQITKPSCTGDSDGAIELKPIGGSGDFEYKWTHDQALNSKLATGLAAGSYQVELIDLAGCGSQNLNITVNDPDPLVASIASITFESCFGAIDGEVSLDLSGGTPPYQVLDYQSVLTGNRLRILNLNPDQYSFDVVDSKGCVVTIEAEVEGPEELSLVFEEESPGCPGDLSGALRVIPSGGTPPYSYVWVMDGSISALATGLSSGEYEVIVQDVNGCEVLGKGTVSEAVPQVRMPTGFIPSQGPYAPIASCPITYKLIIYDRWGQLIHSGTEGWYGGSQGGEMPQGVYSFILSYEYNTADGIKSSDKMGSFTLIK
jgi:hypothetical protein